MTKKMKLTVNEVVAEPLVGIFLYALCVEDENHNELWCILVRFDIVCKNEYYEVYISSYYPKKKCKGQLLYLTIEHPDAKLLTKRSTRMQAIRHIKKMAFKGTKLQINESNSKLEISAYNNLIWDDMVQDTMIKYGDLTQEVLEVREEVENLLTNYFDTNQFRNLLLDDGFDIMTGVNKFTGLISNEFYMRFTIKKNKSSYYLSMSIYFLYRPNTESGKLIPLYEAGISCDTRMEAMYYMINAIKSYDYNADWVSNKGMAALYNIKYKSLLGYLQADLSVTVDFNINKITTQVDKEIAKEIDIRDINASNNTYEVINLKILEYNGIMPEA